MRSGRSSNNSSTVSTWPKAWAGAQAFTGLVRGKGGGSAGEGHVNGRQVLHAGTPTGRIGAARGQPIVVATTLEKEEKAPFGEVEHREHGRAGCGRGRADSAVFQGCAHRVVQVYNMEGQVCEGPLTPTIGAAGRVPLAIPRRVEGPAAAPDGRRVVSALQLEFLAVNGRFLDGQQLEDARVAQEGVVTSSSNTIHPFHMRPGLAAGAWSPMVCGLLYLLRHASRRRRKSPRRS